MTDHNQAFVAYTRYLQNRYEDGPRRNPDDFVQLLLGEKCEDGFASERMDDYRRGPSYHYILARTRHYDHVLCRAVEAGVRQIVLIGSGLDTRAYRFVSMLRDCGAIVFETDLKGPLRWKESQIRKLGSYDHVRFDELDLESVNCGEWLRSAGVQTSAKTLFIAEGVTPYVRRRAVERLLSCIGRSFPSGTTVAYDFKRAGVNDRFGRRWVWRRTCRFSEDHTVLARLHLRWNLQIESVFEATELREKYLGYHPPSFLGEDVAVVVKVQ